MKSTLIQAALSAKEAVKRCPTFHQVRRLTTWYAQNGLPVFARSCAEPLILCLFFCALACGQNAGKPLAPVRAQTATGPLRANPANSRYFTDGSGKAIYLTGSHTWSNLLDRGTLHPPQVPFDYAAYMKWMVSHNFNFMRLWTAELPDADKRDDLYENVVGLPWKWSRTGPGYANDGGLKFDLTKLDQNYFDRMRSRVITAGKNGIYVSVMLFNAYEWERDTNSKDGNPFLGSNNINAVNCPGTCPVGCSQMPDEVWSVEQAYLRKVVDSVDDLDNVLYEVANEGPGQCSDLWHGRVISFVKQYEATKPKQHPVGLTFYGHGSDLTLYKSAADWVSPGSRVPISDGSKVTINDTDHSYGPFEMKHDGKAAQRAWVWENFTSGNNVAFMDPYLVVWPGRNAPEGSTADPYIGLRPDPYWDVLRNAMGSTLTYANRMNLAALTPQPTLSSTHYCLANPGVEYLAYQPSAGAFTVTLVAGTYQYEWLNPSTNSIGRSGTLSVPDGNGSFRPAFSGDAVLYLHILTSRALADGQDAGKPLVQVRARRATGPLSKNPANGRYFTDGSGRAIYLAGSHTWANLMDRGQLNPPGVAFDYAAYMKWMVAHNFNFMRLWTAELPDAGPGPDYWEGNFVAPPWKWLRTGPGNATDGGLRFDLTRLDQNYFDRMRSRVITAGQNGIYVSVMLFNGFEWQNDTNSKDGNPFLDSNNINAINCPGTCPSDSSQMSDRVWNIEQAYIRKVVDTVNDLGNVIYEVSNEAGSYSDLWQYQVISFVKQYETTKPKQHPVGMTHQGRSDVTLYKSAADWISPGSRVPPSDGTKVIINDTDHSYGGPDMKHDGLPAQRAWVWENFTSGNNVAFMDPYLTKWPGRNFPEGSTVDPEVGVGPDNYWDVIRNAMGTTMTYANRMNLLAMTPQGALASTGYCLANAGVEYLVYQPSAGVFTLHLLAGTYQYEWLNPSTNSITSSGTLSVPDGNRLFRPPFSGDAVLYLRASTPREKSQRTRISL